MEAAAAAAAAAAATTPVERTQTIVFMRHGVALHNLRVGNIGPDLTNPYFFDPPLVPYGLQQATEAGAKLRQWLLLHHTTSGGRLAMVLTSPLTRCIQSTLAVLGLSDETPNSQILHGQAHETPIVCIEELREAYGLHYPDRRRNKSLLMQQWPQVQFDPDMSELDELWNESEREKLNHLENRVNRFLHRFVHQLAQGCDPVLVVSHGLWVEACLRVHCPDALPKGERVHNCDLFGGECVSIQGAFVRLQNIRRIR